MIGSAAVIGAALATIVTVPLAPIFWAVFNTYFLFCFVMMLRTHRREIDEARLEHELHRQVRRGRDAAQQVMVITTFGEKPRFFLVPMERFKALARTYDYPEWNHFSWEIAGPRLLRVLSMSSRLVGLGTFDLAATNPFGARPTTTGWRVRRNS